MTCPNLPRTDAQVVVDPDGDLCLRVGTTECIGSGEGHGHRRATIFVCDSKTLSRASAVWKSNLNGPWGESHNRRQGDWVVELPDEKVQPMTTILDIIHLRFESLHADKAEECIPPLYELVILAEKYDLTKVLRPWAKAWLQPLRDQYSNGLLVRKIDDPVALHKQLYIAWELGDLFLVGKTLEDMVFHLKDWQFDGRGPPGLLARAQAASEKIVAGFYDLFQDAIDSFAFCSQDGSSQDGSSLRIKKKCRHGYPQCHCVMLGSLITTLVENGLWPLPEKRSRQQSMRDLLTATSRMVLQNGRGLLHDSRPIKLSSCWGAAEHTSSPAVYREEKEPCSPFGVFPAGLRAPTSSAHGAQDQGNGEQLFFWNNFHKYFDKELNVSNYKPPDHGLKVIGGRKVPKAQFGRPVPLHEKCHPVLKGHDYIEKACSEIAIELESSHLHYIQSQAAKTGIEVVADAKISEPTRKRQKLETS